MTNLSMFTNNIQPQQGKIELEGFEAMKTLMRRITQANPPYAALNQANVNNEEKVEREKVKNSVEIHKSMESDPIDFSIVSNNNNWRMAAWKQTTHFLSKLQNLDFY